MLSICVLSVGERPDRIRLALREPKGFESAPWPSKCVHHNTRFLTGLKTWLLIGPLTLIFFVPMIPPRLSSNLNMHILLCSMGQAYQKTLSQFSVLHFHDKTHFYCQTWKASCFIFARVPMAILFHLELKEIIQHCNFYFIFFLMEMLMLRHVNIFFLNRFSLACNS